jgi:hypothetical protein
VSSTGLLAVDISIHKASTASFFYHFKPVILPDFLLGERSQEFDIVFMGKTSAGIDM